MDYNQTGKAPGEEMEKHLGNVSLNFRYFEFSTVEQKDQKLRIKFRFQKYRSFEVDAATVLYKPISRIISM